MRAFCSLLLAALGLCTFALRAELVILGGGDTIKVDRYEISEEDILLELQSGGRVRLPLSRVDQIVMDEVVDVEPADFELSYDDSLPVPEGPYGELIHEAARRQELNPLLVAAMVRCESGSDPQAVSPSGARGLLQIMPATAERFGVPSTELGDPRRNLEAGTRYLRWLIDYFDQDLRHVLAAFNSGEGTVERFRGVPPYRETRDYVRRVYGELGLGAGL